MKRCELLVPAGGEKQFISAVENGADAIYVGGKFFNARMNADNFSHETLEKAIDYGHVRDVKTYITMNTLMTDEDLPVAYREAEKYYKMGADALIIQDLGFGKVIKENLPDFPIHLSTQAGVYDSKGVEAASKLGYERVVLARELSLEEIKAAVATGVEIEVFVHGALCICYSGQCQLSRYIGGRSGNKGGCAQPCRLPYKGATGQPYPLSPKDLCLIEEAGKLAEIGVSSLKIEGRMKSPEYVATVTSIYRKYLDLWYRNGQYRVEAEDMEELTQIFNRGGFSKGYFYNDPGQLLMSSDFSKNGGIYVGTVVSDSRGSLVEIDAEKQVKKGDYVEIRSKEPVGALITYREELKDGRLRIGDIKAPAFKGNRVYKLTSGELMEKARKTFDKKDFQGGANLKKIPVCMRVVVNPSKTFSVEGWCRNSDGIGFKAVYKGKPPQEATGEIGCSDRLKVQLSKTGNTPFFIDDIVVKEVSKAFVPVSEINAARREVLKLLEDSIKASYKRNIACHTLMAENPEGLIAEGKTGASTVELYFYSGREFESCDKNQLFKKCLEATEEAVNIRVLLPLRDYLKMADSEENLMFGHVTDIIPYIPPMNKGDSDRWIEENLDHIVKILKKRNSGIYVGNLKWIMPFSLAGISVFGDAGLNITNGESKKAYGTLGMGRSISSLEAMEKGLGPYPLMISEHYFNFDHITDRKGVVFTASFNEDNHKSILTSKDEMVDWTKVKNLWEKGQKHVRLYVKNGNF